MAKQWVVLDFGNRRADIVADYGDYAWGSALYEVVGYYANRAEAKIIAGYIRSGQHPEHG